MSVNDSEPNDIYADELGKLWRVVGVMTEPSVIMEEVEPYEGKPKRQIHGVVSGVMWRGFRCIFRPDIKIEPSYGGMKIRQTPPIVGWHD